ncbi:MAG: HAD family phosphatase [Culturomica sp.]|jgi:epoxide hydrolase-like predicted phosphatase|nr:HAD family phosphatase [Culturomica sp.]
MEIKNVVFDLGGVVIVWDPEKIKREFPGDKKAPAFLFENGFFSEYWTEFDRGTLTEGELIEKLAKRSGSDVEEWRKLIEYIKGSLADLPVTCELMHDLKETGHRLFCISNLSVEFYRYIQNRPFFHYLEGKIISGIEKVVKPDPAIFTLLLERYGLKAEETLFIDDLEANVKAAAAMGFRVVHYTDPQEKSLEVRRLTGL